MFVKYTTWHNNYDFVLGETYKALKYKKGWLLINDQLYREECFEPVEGEKSDE